MLVHCSDFAQAQSDSKNPSCAYAGIFEGSKAKPRKFTETVELQVYMLSDLQTAKPEQLNDNQLASTVQCCSKLYSLCHVSCIPAGWTEEL